MCLIIGCCHIVHHTQTKGTSWSDYQVCPCCAKELTIIRAIPYGDYSRSNSCGIKIKEELIKNLRKPLNTNKITTMN